ncbi:class I SAM-dependent methyltransferase [Candidatus Bipolaricaulota bacterium]|nr:class I SAM-dependent methyltransferase [Candidatus Bipolaricaulota bacterium]
MRYQRYGKISSIIYSWLIDPLLWPLRPRIARLCRKHGVNNVLDIGTATGAQCRTLGAAGIHAVGLDLSQTMVDAARARPVQNVSFVVGSAYELPFEDSTFDAALLSLALHEHSEEERNRMLMEAMRIIEPSGYLILAEYSRPPKTLIHIPWRIIQLIENLAGPEHKAGFHQFIAMDGLRGLLRRHGLQPIEVVHSHFHTLTIAVVRRHSTLESSAQSEVA